ncbi:hypothetical protein PROFUN_03315 [Planoprotostelium fungivorum]|uniref:Uncharacterized protein n=1 Tax=Planoprotostelium fungivorum TaxID=1890364 RepID=A0A2P6NWR8_9EUKA|nr:hypothetical protein PROFUN_03315 [Planoprotostelium fungivorum]
MWAQLDYAPVGMISEDRDSHHWKCSKNSIVWGVNCRYFCTFTFLLLKLTPRHVPSRAQEQEFWALL